MRYFLGSIQFQNLKLIFFDRIRLCDVNDSLYVTWLGQVQYGKMRRYWIEYDPLYFKRGRIIVPSQDELCKDLIKEAHDSPWDGHPGVERMFDLLSCVYFWPKMENDIKAFVKTCNVYQVNKTHRKKEAGSL